MRNRICFNDHWTYLADGIMEKVDLPHVWNKDHAAQTGCRTYEKRFNWRKTEGRELFIEFAAVGGICRVTLNGEFIGEHRGGYATFRFALTDWLHNGENLLVVTADNTRYEDINPLTGDFNVYGGIYRDVALVETGTAHFDLLYYGTCGLILKPCPDGTLEMDARMVRSEGLSVCYTVTDGDREIATVTRLADDASAKVTVERPHLWNGKKDPHLYRCTARLLDGGDVLDEVSLPFGFRDIQVTADHGLFLNGEHLVLNGVAKHQDFEGMGCAPTVEQLREDLKLITEIGANAVRLSHYQHPDIFYDLCDETGFLVWAEIPMLGMPDGNEAVVENAKSQLTELILQCRHHPCIFCWGIQNEIAMVGESLEMYRKVEELNTLVHELDDTRCSACANLYSVKNQSQLNFITDIVGYNLYFGWYYGELTDYDGFLDSFHRDNPQVPLGITEYGADCSVDFHSSSPKLKDYSEDFQALYHETVYAQLHREWLWGTFIWNMFDFGSAIRDEGGVKGRNCKGLVTFDRKTKKDGFYYYKARWSQEPFVYIAGRRFVKRCGEATMVKVYTNQDSVKLSVNGQYFAIQEGRYVFNFENVPLVLGENIIEAATEGMCDTITLECVEEPEKSYIFVDPNPEINVKNWFTQGQSADNLFPEDCYSIMDSISTLMESPEAWALLPERITQDPRNKNGSPMTLLRIFQWMRKDFSEDYIKELNGKLNRIKKVAI